MKYDKVSGLVLPAKHIDEKASLKKVIDELVDKAVMANQHLSETYFLTLHAKFNPMGEFSISAPIVTYKIPPFISNSFVFWVSNKKGICELLWMVPPRKKGGKLQPEFNTKGVAYLQAKGGMPK